jgi:hypothetical protein
MQTSGIVGLWGAAMHVPGLLERLRLTGLGEVYLVTRVNHVDQVADLLPLVYGRKAVAAVPFFFMESIPGCGPLHPKPVEGDGRDVIAACGV